MYKIEITAGPVATIELATNGSERLPYYDGNYNVTPTANLQTLATVNKSMSANVVVYSTPYAEVQNPQGGYTVTIL